MILASINLQSHVHEELIHQYSQCFFEGDLKGVSFCLLSE